MKILYILIFIVYISFIKSNPAAANNTTIFVDKAQNLVPRDSNKKTPMNAALVADRSASPVRFSPITLNPEWPKLPKFLIILFCAIIGTGLNGYYLNSFFKKHGPNTFGYVFQACHVYMACSGLMDLILTSYVIPAAIVVLLSGECNYNPLCHGLHFLTEFTTYCYTMFFTLIAAETYFKRGQYSKEFKKLKSLRSGLVSVIVFIVSGTFATFGVFLGLDNDLCERRHFGNYYYRLFTSLVLYGIPSLVIVVSLYKSFVFLRERSLNHLRNKRSFLYKMDSSITKVNLMNYILYVTAWSPYVIIAIKYPESDDSRFYLCVWIGVYRSVISGAFNAAANKKFRHATRQLIKYCFSKRSVPNSLKKRRRRAMERNLARHDVQVHIMHNPMNARTRQRAASSSQETQEM